MKKENTHIIYGLITGVVMVIIGLIIYIMGAAFVPGVQYISYLPFLVGVILSGNAFSKSKDGNVTFGNVFANCFKTAMIVTLIMVAWSILSTILIPGIKEKALDMARVEMMKKPGMTDDKIDMALNITKKYWTVFIIAGAIFGNLFWGAIFSLLGAAFAKKKGQQPLVPTNV
jgi:hypothetical protein